MLAAESKKLQDLVRWTNDEPEHHPPVHRPRQPRRTQSKTLTRTKLPPFYYRRQRMPQWRQ